MKLFRGIKSCLGSIVSGLILVAVGYAGWRWGDTVFPWLEDTVSGVVESRETGQGAESTASEALGAASAERLEQARQGPRGGEVGFAADELTSMLRYTYADDVPAAIHNPRVRIEDGRITLLGDVAVGDVPSFPDLGDVMAILPDTMALEARGTIIPFAEGNAAFLVDRLEAAGLPLPRRVVPGILSAFGREDLDGLPEDAIQVSLPAGIEMASVRGDLLVLRTGG